nr:histidine utilization repressor [Caulobacter sp. RHG1]
MIRRIRSEISDHILSGDWPPGYRIPFEHELTAQYGCSRMTVSRALGALAETGLIERRRKLGTFVARPRTHSLVLDVPDIAAEVIARGETYAYELLSHTIRTATQADLEHLDLDRPVRVLVMRCLHRAGGRPYGFEERVINLEAAPEAERADFSAEPPNSWLLAHVPWTQAEHRISAVNAARASAAILAIAIDTACLVVERRTWRGSDKITHVRLTYPGDAYDLVARFSPRPNPPTA